MTSLFVRPSYHHYYFGDYYASNNFQSGYYPWYSFHQSRYGYSPIFAHYAAVNRRDRAWEDQLRTTYAYRTQHQDARPPPSSWHRRMLILRMLQKMLILRMLPRM